MQDIFVDYPGDWRIFEVVSGGQNQKYIGRVVEQTNDYYVIQPALEYMNGLVETKNGVQRMINITPIDMCISFDSKFRLKGSQCVSMMYFDEMDNTDKREYEKMVHQGVAHILTARAEKSGITLASNLPPQQKPSIFK